MAFVFAFLVDCQLRYMRHTTMPSRNKLGVVIDALLRTKESTPVAKIVKILVISSSMLSLSINSTCVGACMETCEQVCVKLHSHLNVHTYSLRVCVYVCVCVCVCMCARVRAYVRACNLYNLLE